MSGSGKTVLIAGLGRFTAAPVVNTIIEKIQAGLKQAQEAGYDTTMLELNPGDPKGSLESVRQTLKSKNFDGLLIGYGLRGMKENTLLFEDVVNCARELRPGTKLLFATSPDGILETLERL